MLEIRIAKENEYELVKAFYYSLIDAMQDAEYTPGWEKGVYPSDDYLKASICRKELFIMTEDTRIYSAMIVNHEYNESYEKAMWPTDAKPEEITVIHALGVHPDSTKKGMAKEMVAKVISLAKEQEQKVIRLDVLDGNVPAEQLYTHMRFRYVDTILMYYEDTGWTDYKLYEYGLRFHLLAADTKGYCYFSGSIS